MLVGPCIKYQRGMSMMEALITLLIMSIIGMGIAYMTGRAMVAQRNMGAQHLAVSQMRHQLKTGQCQSSAVLSKSLQIGSQTLAAACQSTGELLTVEPSAIGVASQVVTVNVPVMSADSPIFGGEITISGAP